MTTVKGRFEIPNVKKNCLKSPTNGAKKLMNMILPKILGQSKRRIKAILIRICMAP